jgi:hypothetical protein
VKVDAGQFFIPDEQFAQSIDSCIDTDHTFTRPRVPDYTGE